MPSRPDSRIARLAIAASTLAIVPGVGALDLVTGDDIGVHLFYFGPLAVASWVLSRRFGILIAVWSAAVVYGADALFLHRYPTLAHGLWDTALHLGSFLLVSLLTSKVRSLLEHERQAAAALRQSLDEIQELRSLIPICAWCKNIRNDAGYWGSVEAYFGTHAKATFTHGICPDCKAKVLAE